jgi:hypothetical protein
MGIEDEIDGIAEVKRAMVDRLGLLDANLWLGKPEYFPRAEELAPAALEAELESYGIGGGLVSHWDAVRLSAQDGNQMLLDAEGALPRKVWTAWTGLPLSAGEQGPLPGSTAHPRLRAVRLFPRTHHFLLSPWVVGSLCEWCVSHNLPLLLWHVEIEWEQVHALAGAFPKLQFIIDTQWQKILYHNRTLFSLMDSRENVLLETSNFLGQDSLSWAARRWGAERLLFGSFLPASDPYAPIGMILDADLSAEEKALIAGGNLKRLIDGVRI